MPSKRKTLQAAEVNQVARQQFSQAQVEADRKAKLDAFNAQVQVRQKAELAANPEPDQNPFGGTITREHLTDIERQCKDPGLVSSVEAMIKKNYSDLDIIDAVDPGINPAYRALHHLPGEPDTPFAGGPAGFINSLRNVQNGQDNPTCSLTVVTNEGEKNFVYGTKVIHNKTYVQGRLNKYFI